MSIQEMMAALGVKGIVSWCAAILVVLSTLVEVSKIKINPWSSLAKAIGRAINADVLQDLSKVKQELEETKTALDRHIEMDDKRNADMHRANILQFNTALLRNIQHTKEDFSEIMYNIDCYERYCREHPNYQNNRAVHAIANIKRVYADLMKTRNFL